MLPIIGDIIQAGEHLVEKIVDKIWMDKDEKARLEFSKEELKAMMRLALAQMDFQEWMKEFDDLASSRALAMKEAERAPWLIRLLNGFVRPYGGIGALTILFYTIVYKHLGQLLHVQLLPLQLTDSQSALLGGIIGFYFVLRQRSKEKGVATRP